MARARRGTGERKPTAPSERLPDLLDLHRLDEIAFFGGREAIENDTAVKAFLDLASIVLEALETADLPGPHEVAFAQDSRAGVPPHDTLGDHAAGDDVRLAQLE